MNKFALAALVFGCSLLAGCDDAPTLNEAGLTHDTYKPSNVNHDVMVFPGGDHTVFKAGDRFQDPQPPQPYSHPKEWVVYMAAPGWTNGGKPIVDRLFTDSVALSKVVDFVNSNKLRAKVKVAWLQYDKNPDLRYMDDLSTVPDNFIPLFLKPHGIKVDYYVYSPAARRNPQGGVMTYDAWLKPYLPFAKKQGDKYVAATEFQRIKGFDDVESKYWDSWSRHWFIVDPNGKVVDAYFSNMGSHFIQGADWPINSLIHHLELDPSELKIPKIITAQYDSYYTPPYWEQFDADFQDRMGMGSQK